MADIEYDCLDKVFKAVRLIQKAVDESRYEGRIVLELRDVIVELDDITDRAVVE